MSHLTSNNGVTTSCERHELALNNFGYYHGYKGYRFYKVSSNPLQVSDFDEIIALNELTWS